VPEQDFEEYDRRALLEAIVATAGEQQPAVAAPPECPGLRTAFAGSDVHWLPDFGSALLAVGEEHTPAVLYEQQVWVVYPDAWSTEVHR
jgi:hypothetical protein